MAMHQHFENIATMVVKLVGMVVMLLTLHVRNSLPVLIAYFSIYISLFMHNIPSGSSMHGSSIFPIIIAQFLSAQSVGACLRPLTFPH